MDKPTIHVSQVGGCRRVTSYKILDVAPLPAHFVTARGIMTHRAIEMALRGQTPNWEDYSAFGLEEEEVPQQLFSRASEEAFTAYEKAISWLRSTKLIKEGELLWSEESYQAEFPDYVLRGRPDIHTQDKIFDFKTGRKRVTDDLYYQLTGYHYLLMVARKIQARCFVIFLGDDPPREVELEQNRLAIAWQDFKADMAIAAQDKAWKPHGEDSMLPVDVGYHCVFCRYRHVCRGI